MMSKNFHEYISSWHVTPSEMVTCFFLLILFSLDFFIELLLHGFLGFYGMAWNGTCAVIIFLHI